LNAPSILCQQDSWLVEAGIASAKRLAPLREETGELTAIFVTIVKRAKTVSYFFLWRRSAQAERGQSWLVEGGGGDEAVVALVIGEGFAGERAHEAVDFAAVIALIL